jgi:hypothetical protein
MVWSDGSFKRVTVRTTIASWQIRSNSHQTSQTNPPFPHATSSPSPPSTALQTTPAQTLMTLRSSSPIQALPSLLPSLPSHQPSPLHPLFSTSRSPLRDANSSSKGGGELRSVRNAPPPGKEREASSIDNRRERVVDRAWGEGRASRIRRMRGRVGVERRCRRWGDVAVQVDHSSLSNRSWTTRSVVTYRCA